ncbi:CPBP family intramembrane metalloprotease [Actinoplanes sp. LDG1-06]|uniref:CPBP family intramembrane metalloprotease n=1 Tax=Paractinoplanes ovalisporus TaxID=2810368 RepID=A0ABS2A785_9ACTN|nr:CPBP family intramembrane glutamic endopeptidase [Actinoplanes ovalisporus]MBM2615702.1 CPBP family intramembrane metalloprotease [Actinoplanes ovalisporus]
MNLRTLRFAVTFLAAWFVLDRLATSPPRPLAALAALAAAAAVITIGWWQPLRRLPALLGLGRPAVRACLVATAAGSAVLGSYLAGAALLGVDLRLRPGWPLVLAGVLVFHGLAEELVWRGFAFGWLRRSRPFWRAVAWSMPLIAVTHVPLLIGNGWAVGTMAVLSAAVTCVPLAWLWESGGRTMWAPAILHGLIGTWQLWERDYPATFSMVVLGASILVPLLVLLTPRPVGGLVLTRTTNRAAMDA